MTEDKTIETWRAKAEELRTAADNTRSLGAQRSFRRLADQYEELADRTEAAEALTHRRGGSSAA